ncbi:MAG TPA: hypothetical protein DEA44_11645 [Firmicutes bacterium]|mgnify:CR=1 FL=1|nr:hypothetical protein [Bacillota bacterium]HWR55050.1 DUF2062 domain-containing protein [Negativicutes bacterium]
MNFKRRMRYMYIKMKRMKDNPRRLARGLALGVFLNFLPTFGTGFFIALIVARFVRANVVLACTASLATKWCIPILYAINLKVGQTVLGMPSETLTTLWTKVAELDLSGLLSLGKPFILGSVLNSLVVSYLSYFVFISIFMVLKRMPLKN